MHGQNALIYSAAVRENGDSLGRRLGALGIVFNWDGLAQPILRKTSQNETRCPLLYRQQPRRHLAGDSPSSGRIQIPDFARILNQSKGYFIDMYEDQLCCIAHAASPGFETYRTGWFSLIIQPVGDV